MFYCGCVWQHETVAGMLQCTAKLPSLLFIPAQPLIQSPRLREDWLNSRLLNAWDPHWRVNDSTVLPIFVILGLDPAQIGQFKLGGLILWKITEVCHRLWPEYILYIVHNVLPRHCEVVVTMFVVAGDFCLFSCLLASPTACLCV